MSAPYSPLDDAMFRALLAGVIESAHEVREDKTLYAAMPFRALLLQIAEKHGLTRTCALLESFL